MTEEYIKDFNTQLVIGILRTENNGDQVDIDFTSRHILGYYRKQYDHTTDFYGRVLTHGNTVASLILNKKN